MVIYEPKKIEEKWGKEYQESGIFTAKINKDKKKFFLTVPVPYPDGYLHLGQLYTWTRADIYARFMRMRGYNVLFPQSFHFTGGPVATISLRIRNGEKALIDRFVNQGVPPEQVKKFGENPLNLTLYFTDAIKRDFIDTGMSIDWSRSFMLSYTKSYSKFVQWQFRKLREKGLITQGTHPVIWCPNENTPLGDHDRLVGEGEYPIQFDIIKFPLDGYFLPAATLRPETIFGVTNIWLNPNIEYREIILDSGERWIVSAEFESKLKFQLKNVKSSKTFDTNSLLHKKVRNPITGEEIPILAADFVDKNIATGVVMSVPMHAPFDFVYLKRIEKEYPNIKPKKIIDVQGTEDLMKEALDKFGEKDLDSATRFVYNKELNFGVMNQNCADFSGMSVKDARKKMEEKLESMGLLDRFYEPSGEVICRCGARGVVKVLENQWFIDYSNKEWKDRTLNHVMSMKIYPEEAKPQLVDAIVNMEEKAAVRKGGLGTPLPWDQDWLIEPLSDSTIYMSFYTIAHLIQKIDEEKINDELFDYVFLDGPAPSGIDESILKEMKQEFDYWYPVDLRITGRELIPNHVAFYIFTHVAIFPQNKWPRSLGINGWITVNKQKLSKSKGGLTIRSELEKYGADELRLVAYSANGIDDADWDTSNINSFDERINFLMSVIELLNGIKGERKVFDEYLLSKINSIVDEVTENFENMRYRSAIFGAFFESTDLLKFYLEIGGNSNETIKRTIETIIRLVHPVFPFITEELDKRLGGKQLLEEYESWPVSDPSLKNEAIENEMDVLKNTIEDIKNLLNLLKVKPNQIIIRIADKGRFEAYNSLVSEVEKSRDLSELQKKFGRYDFLLGFLKNPKRLPDRRLDHDLEHRVFSESRDYLMRLFNSDIKVEISDDKKAIPGKPGIKIA